MHLDDLELRIATFEIRYDPSFLVWDRSGTLWTALREKFPQLTVAQAAPNEVLAQEGNKRFSAGAEKAFLMTILPETMPGDFPDQAAMFTKIVSDTLDLKSFTRVGFRTVYFKRFAEGKDAADAMLKLGLLVVPQGRHFGIDDGASLQPEYSVRIEGEALGYTVRVKAQEITINIDLPPELARDDIKSGKETKHELIFDIDYYTTATVLLSQLRVSDWIQQVFHGIRRDSRIYLEK
jgi:hypothetical protein